MVKSSTFQPNWTSSPGDTIIDILHERGITLDRFALQMGNSKDFIEKLIGGDKEITIDISEKLTKVLGASEDFWLRREFQYREDLVRLKRVEETSWLKLLPIADMIKFGWIRSQVAKDVRALLSYFGVDSISEWHLKYEAEMAQVSFRTSPKFNQKPAAVAAWLRFGEIQSQDIVCSDWNSELFRTTLPEIKKLTRVKDPAQFLPKLIGLCAICGVAVAIARTPNGCQASGVTKFLTSKRALIMLSFRYLTDDHFWFTFFHEAGHLILHGTRGIFVEEIGQDRLISQEEEEANNFAVEQLVPKELRSQMMKIAISNKKSIIGFAAEAGVSPGIIVGQLQHAGRIDYGRLNTYKRKYSWENMPVNFNP